MKNNLPEVCYSVNLVTNQPIILRNGVTGYYRADVPTMTYDEAEAFSTERNKLLEVTEAERKQMEIGSMFGWN